MIWLKRLAPIAVIALALLAYQLYSRHKDRQEAEREQTCSLAAARIWVASAIFRDQPEHFIAYRDSLLAEYNLDDSTMWRLVAEYEKQPDKLLSFSRLLQVNIDSLIAIEDSIASRYDSISTDSTQPDTLIPSDSSLTR